MKKAILLDPPAQDAPLRRNERQADLLSRTDRIFKNTPSRVHNEAICMCVFVQKLSTFCSFRMFFRKQIIFKSIIFIQETTTAMTTEK